MHGNGLLFRTFLILVVSAGILIPTGLSIGRGANGVIVWPYIALSLLAATGILIYALRIKNSASFTNKPHALFLMALAGVSCLVGMLLSIKPF